eukprot:1154339-Pelagomonas_calceolata.AAC.4
MGLRGLPKELKICGLMRLIHTGFWSSLIPFLQLFIYRSVKSPLPPPVPALVPPAPPASLL